VSLELALTRAVNREQRLALLGHVVAIANTMAYAHERNIAHRDLKPHNVLVGRFGETVILDWGLAKELGTPLRSPSMIAVVPSVTTTDVAQLLAGKTTRPGDVLGTPAFMPPEQARGEDVDQRADVYALGAILEQLLVGRLPRKAADAALAHAQPSLVAICRRATSPTREDRHADGAAFARELRAAIEPPPPVAAIAKPVRWPLIVGVIVGLLGALTRWL
jgi:serine/threonine protein kinase